MENHSVPRMNVGFVLDSSSDIPWEEAEKRKIQVVPLTITVKNQVFEETKDFDLSWYYSQLENDSDFIPKTSQPSPQAFFEAYEKLVDHGVTSIIVITISSQLSGTFNSARLAAKEFQEYEDEISFYFVDTKNASYPAVFLLRHGLEWMTKGLNPEQLASALQSQTNRIKTHILVPTLKYLHAGGRLSAAKYMIGRLLRTKPIIGVTNEGTLQVVDKVTTIEKGLTRLIELSVPDPKKLPNRIAIVHTNDETLATQLANLFKSKYPSVPFEIVLSRTTISAHIGPHAVAIIADYAFQEQVKSFD